MTALITRPHLSAGEYLTLLRAMLNGESVPYYSERYERDEALHELVSDVRLAHMNETSRLRRSLEVAEDRDRRNAAAVQRLWTLVFATGNRKTMRTDEVRDALEGAQ